MNNSSGRKLQNAGLTNANHVELKATLQQFPLNLGGDTVEPDVALRDDGISVMRCQAHGGRVHCCRKTQTGVSGIALVSKHRMSTTSADEEAKRRPAVREREGRAQEQSKSARMIDRGLRRRENFLTLRGTLVSTQKGFRPISFVISHYSYLGNPRILFPGPLNQLPTTFVSCARAKHPSACATIVSPSSFVAKH